LRASLSQTLVVLGDLKMANFMIVLWFPVLAWLDVLSSMGYTVPEPVSKSTEPKPKAARG
jgi:hypothetical protein